MGVPPSKPTDPPSVHARRTLFAFVGLLLALLFSVFGLGRYLAPGEGIGPRVLREAVDGAEVGVLLLWLVFAERLPLQSIGLRRLTWSTLLWGILGAVALVGIIILYGVAVAPHMGAAGDIANRARAEILKQPLWYRLILVPRAAVYEEFLFRGYFKEKVRDLTGSWVAAFIVSVAAFTYDHLAGWGWAQLIPVAGAGMVLSAMYIRRRDLPSNMLAHFITDSLGFLFG